MSNIEWDECTIYELAMEEGWDAAEWARDLQYDLRLTEHQREYLTAKICQACRARSVREIAKVFRVSLEEASRRLTQAGDPFQI